MTDEIQFDAIVENLPQMMQWIREKIEEAGFKECTHKIELALEEAIVNVIHHALQKKGAVKLICRYQEGRQIEFDICDEGPAFNPLKVSSEFDKNATLEERKEGGLGIPIIRKNMDAVLYRREENTNILTLVLKTNTD